MASNPWKIHKFGGSSLADAACFRRVASIVLGMDDPRLGVVVSAMGGMTDALLGLVAAADAGTPDAPGLAAIEARYVETATQLLEPSALAEVMDAWHRDAAQARDVLAQVRGRAGASKRDRDVIAGFGELWSARLLAAFLRREAPERGGTWIDARQVITIHDTELGPLVRWPESQARFDAALPPDFEGIAVATGFIASDEQGRPTTLGRNGSDHSAAIFAALARAAELTIWTDVDGILSADPRRVPEARVIEQMTYDEAMELAYFGAKVLHPQTMGPAVGHGIPIFVRNSHRPDLPGSRIATEATADEPIKGITAVGNLALLNLEGAGMIGVPGTADRLFAALKGAGVSVTLISQASSEHSICLAVPRDAAPRAREVVEAAFAEELAGGQIQRVQIEDDQSIVAVVGDGMAGMPGVAARFFGALGRAGVNVRAIAQGSSERNISAVVSAEDTTRALRATHASFYLSAETLSIGLIGPGSVGATLLRQLEAEAPRLRERFNLDLRVRAIARSARMLLGDPRVELDGWQASFDANAVPRDLDALVAHVNPDHLPHAVLLDCTASPAVAERYPTWLEQGIHVITPNKKAFSGPLAGHAALRDASRRGSSRFLYETTVGAALPIIGTLQDLLLTGDEVRSVQGILSGTLAYLFNVYDGSEPFSTIVRRAREAGYTEPDPRDDLSGTDVARKLTILGREMGLELELGGFPVQSLVPEALRAVALDEFMDRLEELDAPMQAELDRARAAGQQLRYVGRLGADGEASVGLEAVGPEHPFAHIALTDNIVQFETARYSNNPLVVQGPGAGPEVTAAGVFADLLRLARYLSAD